jgi:formate hydrogenlyase subunit 3/multisubunit Na+/H+ antiporter MnhD subunit
LISAVLSALALAMLAWLVPIGEAIRLGPWTIKLDDVLYVLGRRFELHNSDRPVLALNYLIMAFWFGGARAAHAGRMFIPLGLIVLALLTAALAVEPFLYAALLIELAVLVSVAILTTPGQPVGRGAVRFLTFQTFGMPFILFAGWLLAGMEASPGNEVVTGRLGILMGLGFMFLLAVFPFHSWIPMLMDDTNPYKATFIFLILPEMITLFGLGFLDRYTWLRETQAVYRLMQLSGILMILFGGVWVAFQRHLGRILGYTVITEIGFSLLTISVPGGLPLYFAMLLPRALGLGVWALALAVMWNRTPDLRFSAVQGSAHQMPFITGALLTAHFCVAGLPLLAYFPLRLVLWSEMAAQTPWLIFGTLVGSLGLFGSGLRSLAVLVGEMEHPADASPADSLGRWRVTESGVTIFLLGMGIAVLLLIGIFPQWFLPPFFEVARVFEHLAPIP